MLLGVYLSLIGKAIRADDAFIELDRGLRVAWFVLVPEVHVVEPEPLRESFIPLEVVEERPGCVALHIYPILNRCKMARGREQTKDSKMTHFISRQERPAKDEKLTQRLRYKPDINNLSFVTLSTCLAESLFHL